VVIGRGAVAHSVLVPMMAAGYALCIIVMIVYVAAFRQSRLGVVGCGFVIMALVAQGLWFLLKKRSVAYIKIGGGSIKVVDSVQNVTMRCEKITAVGIEPWQIRLESSEFTQWLESQGDSKRISPLRTLWMVRRKGDGAIINLGLYTPRQRQRIVAAIEASVSSREKIAPEKTAADKPASIKPGEWTSPRTWWLIVTSVIFAIIIAFLLIYAASEALPAVFPEGRDTIGGWVIMAGIFLVVGFLTSRVIRYSRPWTLALTETGLTVTHVGRRSISFGDIAELTISKPESGTMTKSLLIKPKPEYFERHHLGRNTLTLLLNWETMSFTPAQTREFLPRLTRAVRQAGGTVWEY
jgi:hypothetical protein